MFSVCRRHQGVFEVALDVIIFPGPSLWVAELYLIRFRLIELFGGVYVCSELLNYFVFVYSFM